MTSQSKLKRLKDVWVCDGTKSMASQGLVNVIWGQVHQHFMNSF